MIPLPLEKIKHLKEDNMIPIISNLLKNVDISSLIVPSINHLHEAFFITDENWILTYVNSDLIHISKQSAHYFNNKTLWESAPDLIGTFFEKNYRYAFENQTSLNFKDFYKPWNKYLEVNIYPNGKGISVYLKDMSKQQELPSQIDLLRTCIDRLNDVVIITQIDPSNPIPTVIFVNEAFLKISGYTKEEVVGKNLAILHGPPGQEDQIKKIRYAMQHFQPIKTELLNYTKLGTVFGIELDIVPVANQHDEYVHCIIVGRDISERKKNEILLFKNQENLQFVLESGNVAHWDKDFINNTHSYSALYFKMLGINTPVDTEKWSIKDFYNHVHVEDKQLVSSEYNRVLNGMENYNLEFRVVWPNGEIHWLWCRGRAFLDEVNHLTRANGIITDISERKKSEDQIKQLAFYDVLTQLPNRRLLTERLQSALLQNNNYYNGLLFLDLDNFKTLNDTLGHDKGDILLKAVSKCIEGCLRKTDTVARLGGDEFVVFISHINTSYQEAKNEIQKIGNKILTLLNKPFKFGSYEHLSPASIGATIFAHNSYSVDDLLKQADVAMYQAKANGKNSLVFFEQKMQEAINYRVVLENDLRRGILHNEFVLYYQPQLDNYNKVYGAEALIRWIHPEKGLISPLTFIPLAEETGLIVKMSLWVFKEACQQLVKWSQEVKTAHLTLAVNVSINHFKQDDFIVQLIEILESTKADPTKLKLELTESALITNMEDGIAKMNILKQYGVNFSLDDFGTGYSSLNYLKRMPLQQLKIDQSFVRDIFSSVNDAIISKTIINLAQNLNLEVIAEGVETIEQKQFLLENGCNRYQGYLFSKPLPISDFMIYFYNN